MPCAERIKPNQNPPSSLPWQSSLPDIARLLELGGSRNKSGSGSQIVRYGSVELLCLGTPLPGTKMGNVAKSLKNAV